VQLRNGSTRLGAAARALAGYPPVSRRVAFAVGLASLLVGAALLLLQRGVFPRVQVRGPNVVVFLVDTLRPDHLGVYGHSPGSRA